jgi:hypothetical protein
MGPQLRSPEKGEEIGGGPFNRRTEIWMGYEGGLEDVGGAQIRRLQADT